MEERDEFSVGCETKKQNEIHEWKEEVIAMDAIIITDK